MALKSILVKPKGVKSNNNRLQCSICKQRFWLACKFNDHMASHLLLFCNICNQYFYDQKLLDEHYLIHKDVINTYDCDKCSKKFLHKYELSHHLKSHNRLVNEPPSKRRKKSVHFNNVLEMKSIEEDFSDDESFYDKFSSRAKKTRSGRIVKVKKLHEDETDGEDEDEQSEDPNGDVPLVNENRAADSVAREICKKTSTVSKNNKSVASNVVKKSSDLNETQKSVSANNVATRDISRKISVVPESNKSVAAATVKKTSELKETQKSVSADNNIARDISRKASVVSENNKSVSATTAKRKSEVKETHKSISADNNNVPKDPSRKTCVVSENNKPVESSRVKKASELKETQNNVSVDNNSSYIASSVSGNINECIKESCDKQLKVIVEKLPNHIYQECVQKGNVCSYKSVSAKKTLDVVVSNPVADKTAKLPVSKIPKKTASVPKISGQVKQCSKTAYAKKSTPAKSANSCSSVAKEVYSNALPRSPSHVNKQFVYVGSNPDMNKIKKVLAEISHLSKDDFTKSSSSKSECSGVSQNLSSSNIQNSPLTSKTQPTATIAMKSQSFASTVKAITDDRNGILEKTVVDNFIVIKVTPEYMQKMQQTPLDIPKVLPESCEKTRSASNDISNSSVEDKICDNQTTPPKGNTLSKDINSVSPTKSNKTVKETRVTLAQLAVSPTKRNKTLKETRVTLAQLATASPKVINDIKQTSMKNAPAPSVKEGRFSTGQNVPELTSPIASNKPALSNTNLKESILANIGKLDKHPKSGMKGNEFSSPQNTTVTASGENVNEQITSQDVPAPTSAIDTHSKVNLKVSSCNANQLYSNSNCSAFEQNNEKDKDKTPGITSNSEAIVIEGDDISAVLQNISKLVSLNISVTNVDPTESIKETTSQEKNDCTILETSKSDTGNVNMTVSLTECMKETLSQKKNDCTILETPKSDTGNVDMTVDSTKNTKETSSQKKNDRTIVETPKSDTGNVDMTVDSTESKKETSSQKKNDRTIVETPKSDTGNVAMTVDSTESKKETYSQKKNDRTIVETPKSDTGNVDMTVDSTESKKETSSQKKNDRTIQEMPKSDTENVDMIVDSTKNMKEASLQKNDDCIILKAPKSDSRNISNKSIQINRILNRTSLKKNGNYISLQNVPKQTVSKVSAVGAQSPDIMELILSQNDDDCVIVLENITESVIANISKEANHSNTFMKETPSEDADSQSSVCSTSEVVTSSVLNKTTELNKITNHTSKNNDSQSSINPVAESVSASNLNKSTDKESVLTKDGFNQQSSLTSVISGKLTATVPKTASRNCLERTSSAKNNGQSSVSLTSPDASEPVEEDCQIPLSQASDLPSTNASSITLRPRRPELDLSMKYNDKQIAKRAASDFTSINSPGEDGVKKLFSAGKDDKISSQDETEVATTTALLHSKKQKQLASPTESPKSRAVHKTCTSPKTKQVSKQPHLIASTTVSYESKPRRAKLDFSAKYNDKQISRQIASDLVSINSPKEAGLKKLSSAEKGNEISSPDETEVTTSTVLLRSRKRIQLASPTVSPKLRTRHKTCAEESTKTKQVPKQPHLIASTGASHEIKKRKMDLNENKLLENSHDVVSEVDRICTVSKDQTNSVCKISSSDSVSAKDKISEVEKNSEAESSHSAFQRLTTIKNIQNEIDMISAQNKHEKSKAEKLLERYKAKMEEKERRKREKYDFKKKVREFLRN